MRDVVAALELPEDVLHARRDEVEVHLAYGGQRTIGRGDIGGGPAAAANATIDALRGLRLTVPFSVKSAASGLNGPTGDAVMVVLASEPPGMNRFGVSAGGTASEAAARATLHALNRYLSLPRGGQALPPAPAPTSN